MRLLTITILFAPIRICSWNRWETDPWIDTWRWENNPPIPVIEQPGDGDEVVAGGDLTLFAVVEDWDGWPEGITAEWFIGSAIGCTRQPLQPDWTTECATHAPNTPGTYDVGLLVTDDRGNEGWDQVQITVVSSAPPTITITSPMPSTEWAHDTPVPLVAQVTDPDGVGGLEVVWIVDEIRRNDLTTPVRPDGIAATAEVFDPGPHELVAQVQDGAHTVEDRSRFRVLPDPDADTDTNSDP